MAEIITIDAGAVAGIGAATLALSGLVKVLGNISQGVKDAFSVKGYQDYLQTVKRFGKDLAGELLTLQLSFGRMKVAIAQAFAPIAEVVVPYINQGIRGVIRFADTLRQFFGGLIAGITGNEGLAESADRAAAAENTLKTAATSAGKAVKRSIMGFDELNRLNGSSGNTASSFRFEPLKDTLSPQVEAAVDRVMTFLKPLLAIDLTPLKTALQSLAEAFSRLSVLASAAFDWLWHQLLAPFIAWVLEVFAPALAEHWAGALELVAMAVDPLLAGIQRLWTALKPVAAFVGETVVGSLNSWRGAFESLTAVLYQKAPQIVAIFQNIGQRVTQLWSTVGPVLTLFGSHVSQVFSGAAQSVSTMIGFILDAMAGLNRYVTGTFTGNWRMAWEGVKDFLKGVINGIIGLLNALISRMVTSLNSVVRAANKLSFTVPSWVPGIGGRSFGFHMKTVTAPQIPYLAQGAVLPANKPFLAMVGDQRHGTNVEAPLETIQEAVAVVLGQHLGSYLSQMVAEQRQTRCAVENIQVGDSVIGRAAQRYQNRLQVAAGTAF